MDPNRNVSGKTGADEVDPKRPRALTILSVSVAALAALASAWALLVPGLYSRDPAFIAPQLLGQDLVTLALIVPALLVSTWLARRDRAIPIIAQAGLLVYTAYTYATYAFGARFNPLFVAYCAILGMSTYALFLAIPRALRHADAADVARLPRKTLIGVMYGIAAVFTLLWGIELAAALAAGTPPRSAVDAQTPTSIVHVLDLAFVLPLGAISATLLLLRRPAGIPLAGIFLVKALTIALAVLSMAAFTGRAGEAVNAPVAAAMVGVVVLVGLVGWRYARAFAAMDPPRRWRHAA